MISAGPRTKADIMHGIKDVVTSKKVANNTVEYTNVDGDRVIRLHDTDIVTFKKRGTIILNSGGWKTSTTQNRINDYLKVQGLEVRVYQADSRWYLQIRGPESEHVVTKWGEYDRLITVQNVLFFDGIRIYRGRVPKADVERAERMEKETEDMLKRIGNYAKMVKAVLQDGVPGPSDGDCFICRMADDSTEHLLAHMDEGYVPGQLLWNAVKESGYQPQTYIGWNIGKKLDPKGFESKVIVKAVRKYIKRRVGIPPV